MDGLRGRFFAGNDPSFLWSCRGGFCGRAGVGSFLRVLGSFRVSFLICGFLQLIYG